jgi:hypothetical protein
MLRAAVLARPTFRAAVVAGAALALASCGSTRHATAGGVRHETARSNPFVHWLSATHATQPVDVTAPRADGRLTLAADGHLFLLAPPAGLTPFARGRGGYSTALGLEPYITATPSLSMPSAGCSFRRDDVYALQPGGRVGVIRVDGAGHGTRFADLPHGGLPNGITFDQVGQFGHRLLVTEEFGPGHASVYAFDCRGHRTTVTRTAPRLEGGISVAPSTFGAYGGMLIATNEYNGNLIAVSPSGQARVLAASGLPAGPDTGVESAGFVPAGGRSEAAYVTDRYTRGNPHPGDDVILELPPAELSTARVRSGDLLVVTEGGALTDDVRCAATCTVRYVASGPARAHVEGHVEFQP